MSSNAAGRFQWGYENLFKTRTEVDLLDVDAVREFMDGNDIEVADGCVGLQQIYHIKIHQGIRGDGRAAVKFDISLDAVKGYMGLCRKDTGLHP